MNPFTIQASHTATDSRARNKRCSVYAHQVCRISPTFLDPLIVDYTLSGKNGYGCTFRTNRPSEWDPLTLDFYRAHIYLPSALQRRNSRKPGFCPQNDLRRWQSNGWSWVVRTIYLQCAGLRSSLSMHYFSRTFHSFSPSTFRRWVEKMSAPISGYRKTKGCEHTQSSYSVNT